MINEIRYYSVAKQVGLLLTEHTQPNDKVVVTVADIEKYGRVIQQMTVAHIINAISTPIAVKDDAMTSHEQLVQRKEWLEYRIASFKRKLASGKTHPLITKKALVELESELATIEAQLS